MQTFGYRFGWNTYIYLQVVRIHTGQYRVELDINHLGFPPWRWLSHLPLNIGRRQHGFYPQFGCTVSSLGRLTVGLHHPGVAWIHPWTRRPQLLCPDRARIGEPEESPLALTCSSRLLEAHRTSQAELDVFGWLFWKKNDLLLISWNHGYWLISCVTFKD